MKILFVNPSLRPQAPHRFLPVGLGYVVTAVRDAGFDFDLLDIDIGRISDDEVDRFLRHNSYDVIALGCIVTHYRWTKWFLNTARAHQRHAKLIVGNSIGSTIPEVLFTCTPVDIVVNGEGDVGIVEVLRALSEGRELGRAITPDVPVLHNNGPYANMVRGEGVPGIVFRDGQGRAVTTGLRKAVRKIDDIPYPDWDLFDIERYLEISYLRAHDTVRFPQEQAVVMPINTARGCVFKCTFCHYVFWNDPYRHRSAENIVGELRRDMDKYGANYFDFWDELSFHKLGPAEKFVDALLAADLPIHWNASVRTDLFGRPDVPYQDRLRVASKFKESGVVSLGYSLESGNDEILEAMNKRVKAEYFGEQVRVLREADIISTTSLVFGYPQETPETIAETMGMCLDLGVYPSPGFLLPLPATGMWDHARNHGFIPDPDKFLTELTERQDVVLNMTKMSDQQIEAEVVGWLQKLSDAFGLGLEGGSLVRTGGYNKHAKNQNEAARPAGADAKPRDVSRNTTATLNYAKMTGVV